MANCEQFRVSDSSDPGRAYELCTGEFVNGREPPPLRAWNAWRAERGLEPKDGLPAVVGRATQPAKPWDVSQPSRGLGDVVAKITHATGIDRAVKAVTGSKGCNCKKRQERLNSIAPFAGS